MQWRTRLFGTLQLLALSCLVIACSSGDGEDAPLQAAVPAALSDASFAGRTGNANLYAAVLTHGTGVEAYFCDGEHSYWFRGLPSDSVLELEEASGAKLMLELAGDVVVGRLTVGDTVTRFDLPKVSGEVLFRADTSAGATRLLGGWIKLPDGTQRGAIKVGATVINSALLDGQITCANCKAFSSAMTPAAFTPATAQRTVNEVQKFTVLGFGDSFMSGEGAPVTPGAMLQTPSLGVEEISQGIGTQEIWSSGLPTSRAHNFNLTAAQRSRLTREALACHRGASGLGLAVDSLRSGWPAIVDIIHQTFACSGAKVNNLVQFFSSGPAGCFRKTGGARETCLRFADDMETASIQPQVPEALDFLEAQRLKADAVVMSIGGNDLGFGVVLADCLSPVSLDCTNKDSDANKALKEGRKNLPDLYRSLSTKFSDNGVLASNVFLTSHPNPLLQSTANGLCAGTDYLPDALLVNLSQGDAEFATGVHGEINSQVAAAVRANGWKPITSHIGSALGHGLCTSEPWYNTRNAALFMQGRDLPQDNDFFNFLTDFSATVKVDLSAGMFHPNQRGQREGYMPAYRAELNAKLVERFTPKTPRLFHAVAFRIEGDKRMVTLQWDDINAFESKHVISNTGGGAAINVGADVTQRVITLDGTAGTFTLKACLDGPTEMCSGVTPSVSVEVKVPTHTPRIVLNGPAISTSGQGVNLASSTEARVTWDDSAPSRLYSTVELDSGGTITRSASITSGLVVPYDGTAKRFRVAACNTLGCGPATAWTDIATPPAFELPPVCLSPKRRLLNGCV
ncbi:MAG: hypothetical protein ABI919_06025 [Ramlibacter sp.]